MTFQKTITIHAKTDAEAQQIADAMSASSGIFSAREWQTIAKKLQSKMVQMRVRFLIQ